MMLLYRFVVNHTFLWLCEILAHFDRTATDKNDPLYTYVAMVQFIVFRMGNEVCLALQGVRA